MLLNHKTVQKLMVEMGLYGKKKKAKYRSYIGDIGKVAPNVIDRNFIATALLNTVDIHPPKTGISVHFSCSLS